MTCKRANGDGLPCLGCPDECVAPVDPVAAVERIRGGYRGRGQTPEPVMSVDANDFTLPREEPMKPFNLGPSPNFGAPGGDGPCYNPAACFNCPGPCEAEAVQLVEPLPPFPMSAEQIAARGTPADVDYDKSIHKDAARAWLLMFSGRHAYPLTLTEDMVDIRDIAHAQSMQCRYGGHVRRFYSVAQHSVLMARHVYSDDAKMDRRFVRNAMGGVRYFESGEWDLPLHRLALMMLLHDASDPYVIDIPRPLKYQLYWKRPREGSTVFHDYVPLKDIEAPIEALTAKKYGLRYPFPDIVHEWDNRMLTTERNSLLTFDPKWECPREGLPVPIEYWLPEQAEFEFMKTFNEMMAASSHG